MEATTFNSIGLKEQGRHYCELALGQEQESGIELGTSPGVEMARHGNADSRQPCSSKSLMNKENS